MIYYCKYIIYIYVMFKLELKLELLYNIYIYNIKLNKLPLFCVI